jgi:adenosylhomocysteine nucleosidase
MTQETQPEPTQEAEAKSTSSGDGAPHVAIFAPMVPELQPLLDAVTLQEEQLGETIVHTGEVGNTRVIATMTGIGMGPARLATERILDAFPIAHVLVIGIAGGMGASRIGDLVVPAVVVDRDEGGEYRATQLGELEPSGTIISSDDFGFANGQFDQLVAQGVVAVDMETGAIAAVCEARGVPWTAFRGISDRADDPAIDVEVLNLAGPDGSGDPDALAKYLAANPERAAKLAELGKGMERATACAVDAAVRACRTL